MVDGKAYIRHQTKILLDVSFPQDLVRQIQRCIQHLPHSCRMGADERRGAGGDCI